MARPDERRFVTFPRGHVRDEVILARFRNGLRGRINPDTGQVFTEDEIAIITQESSRFYLQADGEDLYGQAVQSRALWWVDQTRPDRAATPSLEGLHGRLWLPEGRLPATGGSGPVLATATPGTIYTGSTIIGDPTAARARDPAGKRYQVLVTKTADPNGEAALQMIGIDTGDNTNPIGGTVLTWINPPLGSDPQASTTANFSGGFNAETDAEFSDRIIDRIRFKPGAGNPAQMRAWARQSSNAVENAFVYSAALHGGSIVVAITQKRGGVVGPLARIPSIGTLTIATAYLVPPTSPVVPFGRHVLVVPINSEPSNLAMRLSMRRGSAGGWSDPQPWPEWSAAYPEGVKISDLTDQTHFEIETDVALTGSTSSLMVWDVDSSRFIALDVQSIAAAGGNFWDVTLGSPPTDPPHTLAIGDLICPKNERAEVIAESAEAYFDELGPGQLVASTDPRYVRAARFPGIDIEAPIRAGQGIIARLDDTLGGALADAALEDISQSEPILPTSIVDGPNILTLGTFAIYAL